MPEAVYFLWDPRNGDIRYVGRTNDPAARLVHHQRVSRRKSHVDNWKRQMAAEGACCEMAILEKGLSPERAREREAWWVAYGRGEGKWPLTNVSSGGDGGGAHSEETKAKISATEKGKKLSDETKAKMSTAKLGNKSCAGRVLSEEHKAKLNRLGYKHSDEAKAKMSAAKIGGRNAAGNLGKKRTSEQKAKIALKSKEVWARRKQKSA